MKKVTFSGPGAKKEMALAAEWFVRGVLFVGAALALAGWHGRRVALWGAAVASGFHAASHFMDTELGGRDSDPWLLALLTVVLVAAGLLSLRTPQPGRV